MRINEKPRAPQAKIVKLVSNVRHRITGLARRLEPPSFALLDLVTGKWRAVALEAVAKLGVAEHMKGGPRPVAELAQATETDEEALYRVLRALAREGVFEESPPRVFALTPLSRPLLADAPDSILHMVLNFATPREQKVWTADSLLYALRSGEPVHDELFDMDLWTRFEREPEEARIFHAAMVEMTRKVAPHIAPAYDFSRFASVVDLGGGTGELLSAILLAHPTLRGVNVDLPRALAGAHEHFRERGLTDRVELVEGDMLKTVPERHDAYLMKNIVHGFGDDTIEPLLRRVREAVRPDSKLLLVEHVVPESGPYLAFLDLEMMLASFRGRERTAAQFRNLLALHGFELEEIVETPTPFSLLVARPV